MIPKDAVFVEDPTNYDLNVDTKTGMLKQTLLNPNQRSKKEALPFLDQLEPISELSESPQSNIVHAKTFYENERAKQEKIIGSVLLRASTVTVNIPMDNLERMSIVELGKSAF